MRRSALSSPVQLAFGTKMEQRWIQDGRRANRNHRRREVGKNDNENSGPRILAAARLEEEDGARELNGGRG